MIKVTKHNNGTISLNINNYNINLIFKDNKIWLTKKEISNIFWIKKNKVKEILNSIQESSKENFIKNTKKIYSISSKKEKTYYSIDLIINIAYRVNNFTAAKTIIKINRTLKNLWINRKSLIESIKENISKLSIESFFEKKYILNL